MTETENPITFTPSLAPHASGAGQWRNERTTTVICLSIDIDQHRIWGHLRIGVTMLSSFKEDKQLIIRYLDSLFPIVNLCHIVHLPGAVAWNNRVRESWTDRARDCRMLFNSVIGWSVSLGDEKKLTSFMERGPSSAFVRSSHVQVCTAAHKNPLTDWWSRLFICCSH